MSTCLQCIDNFYLMLFSQSLDAVMEERVDVVLNPLDFLPVDALQLGLQVLQIYLEQAGKDRQGEVGKKDSLGCSGKETALQNWMGLNIRSNEKDDIFSDAVDFQTPKVNP